MLLDADAIDPQATQIHTDEQRVVLSTLAQCVAKPGGKFLEVGSWCGDSTVLLGGIAKENDCKLVCVDWWKGNPGTDLAEISARLDVFSLFWETIRDAGLDDVVIPIRSRSDVAAELLRTGDFDLVFLDADHRYASIASDIDRYAPLVSRAGGILCGHDCEGRIADYDMEFLEAGKDVDLHESVHCGVVLAVGSRIENYSLNHAIWSVRAHEGAGGWAPTDLVFPGVEDRRQTPPPVMALSKSYFFARYGRTVYGVPHELSGFDVTRDSRSVPETIVKALRLEDLKAQIGEPIFAPPKHLGSYRGFNVLGYNQRIYAFHGALGHVDVVQLAQSTLHDYLQDERCFIDASLDRIKRLIDRADSKATVDRLQGELGAKEARIEELQEELARRDSVQVQEALAARSSRIQELQDGLAATEARLGAVEGELASRGARIVELQDDLSAGEINRLEAALSTSTAAVEELQAEVAANEARITELQEEIASRDAAKVQEVLAAGNAKVEELRRELAAAASGNRLRRRRRRGRNS